MGKRVFDDVVGRDWNRSLAPRIWIDRLLWPLLSTRRDWEESLTRFYLVLLAWTAPVISAAVLLGIFGAARDFFWYCCTAGALVPIGWAGGSTILHSWTALVRRNARARRWQRESDEFDRMLDFWARQHAQLTMPVPGIERRHLPN